MKQLLKDVSKADLDSAIITIPVSPVRFKNPHNAVLFPDDNEVNPLPSLTIPDQSMTVREIMVRHAQGIPFTAGKVPIYDGADDFDDFIPNLATLDISERADLLERSKRYIQNYQTSEAKKKRDAEKAEIERLYKERYQQASASAPSGGADPKPSAP